MDFNSLSSLPLQNGVFYIGAFFIFIAISGGIFGWFNIPKNRVFPAFLVGLGFVILAGLNPFGPKSDQSPTDEKPTYTPSVEGRVSMLGSYARFGTIGYDKNTARQILGSDTHFVIKDSNDSVQTTDGCQGFWFSISEPGAKNLMTILNTAIASNKTVAVTAIAKETWKGSTGTFCRVYGIHFNQ